MLAVHVTVQSLADAQEGKNGISIMKGMDLNNIINLTNEPIHVCFMEKGSESGATAVGFATKLPDGKVLFFQLTGNLLEIIYKGFKASQSRFGDDEHA